MNSRIGTPSHDHFEYKENPDSITNTNGRTLNRILKNHKELLVINGLMYNDLKYDTKFTFYRKNVHSQNDLCISNSMDDIQELHILPKPIESDHCPCKLSLRVKLYPDLHMVNECARTFRSYDHYDVNKRIRRPIKLHLIDMVKLNEDLDKLARELQNDINNGKETDFVCNKLTNSLYQSCVNNYSKTNHDPISTDIPHITNCTSRNLKAIAEANFECFQFHLNENKDPEKIQHYKELWIDTERIARKKQNEEYNTKVNKKWANSTKNSKELWKLIDWKGKVQEDDKKDLSYQEIYNFFTNIFQSKKTSKSPVISDIADKIYNYEVNLPITDIDIRYEEIDTACRDIGKGTGVDGLPPAISKLLPQSIKEVLRALFQRVFEDVYPKDWENQLLFPITKKDHSLSNPKLRGIGIGHLFSRLYDDVIYKRFNTWFTPNPEQAAKKGQGCIFQIFALLLLIDFSKNSDKSLFIGLLDFEKAYDFLNRAILMSDLMEKGIGRKLLHALYTMYSNTSYTPKITNNLVGDPIITKYGVTQGRKSSGNLYAFAISDLPKSLNDGTLNDFMDPFCVAQLADDTTITAESLASQTIKFQKVIDYTKVKHQHINTKKTKYMHMSCQPITTPISLNDNKIINAVEYNDGYDILGFKLSYSNDVYEIIHKNLKSKMFNIARFYAWLQYNEPTPFFVKIKVLYGCLFQCILYSAEAWGDLSKIESTLVSTEIKALKCCLGVKSGTTTDLVYAEINRPDIIALMKDRQFQFKKKIDMAKKEEALMKEIWDVCQLQEGPSLCDYYQNITDNNAVANINDRKMRIESSEQTMNVRYRSLLGLSYPYVLYNSCLDDKRRKIITRWRLSSHKLHIETGRYTKPRTEKENRKCRVCSIIEDELHAIYRCNAHRIIRTRFRTKLDFENEDIKTFLNPETIDKAIYLSTYLKEIEKNMKDLDMI